MTTVQKIKPAEGLCIMLPNGSPALQFITYKDITVTTNTEGNRVTLTVEFDEPFIKDRVSHHLEALDKEIRLEDV